MSGPPSCARCGHPCYWLWAIEHVGNRLIRRFWGRFTPQQLADPQVVWLCADCTDEVAERLAGMW